MAGGFCRCVNRMEARPGHRDTDPVRCERELKQARSLLFVAATRARGFM